MVTFGYPRENASCRAKPSTPCHVAMLEIPFKEAV
jgi:hypothetical protein